jgi:hypothetical protein
MANKDKGLFTHDAPDATLTRNGLPVHVVKAMVVYVKDAEKAEQAGKTVIGLVGGDQILVDEPVAQARNLLLYAK